MYDEISVVLATYNGERFLKEQLESILTQLRDNDELIISDDGSSDKTVEIIKEFQKKYPHIKLYQGPSRGFIRNFEFLISKAKNKIIFISDQDDIWESTKVEKILEDFRIHPDVWVVLHDAYYINADGGKIGGSIFEDRNTNYGFIRNVLKSGYYGCCMAINSDIRQYILPFPDYIMSYDQCIGLYAEFYKKVYIEKHKLIFHRLHNSNQSSVRNISYKVMFRVHLIKYVLQKVFEKKYRI